jgi:hypothetical protein
VRQQRLAVADPEQRVHETAVADVYLQRS